MSKRLAQRMKLIAGAGSAIRGSVETSEFVDLHLTMNPAIANAEVTYVAAREKKYGLQHNPERAPYGAWGYVLYKEHNGESSFLVISSPFHGRKTSMPLAFASYQEARNQAELLGCKSTHSPFTRTIRAESFIENNTDDVLRFGNCGAPILLTPLPTQPH